MTKWEYRIVEIAKADGSILFIPEMNNGFGWSEMVGKALSSMKEAQQVIDERIAKVAANVVVKRVEHEYPYLLKEEKRGFWRSFWALFDPRYPRR